MKLSDFDFDLPKSLIAQFPSEKRTESKLLVDGECITDTTFSELGEFLRPNDLLVLNDTRVDRKSTRLNSSHVVISYAVFCLKKKKQNKRSQ